MAKELLGKLLVVFFLLFMISNLEAQTNNTLYKNIIASADNFFMTKMDSTNVVGLSAAIIVNDSMIWSNGFGYADKKNKVPMTVNTIVNIGSIAKTFTSLSVMQLQEKGLLNINHPLTTYLPEFKPKTQGIKLNRVTIKSILTHTSGIQPDIWKNSDLASGNYTDVLGFINDTYITYPPGMTGLYSNAGYNILGNMIKVVSKQDYTDYIRQQIFAPLGMNKTGFATDNLKNKAKIYLGGKEVKEYELRDIASGGIYTDITDFSKYAIGLLEAYNGKNTGLIDSSTIHQMFSLQNANVPIESNKKGIGWFMFENDSNFAVYHAGSAGFAQAKMLLIPKSRFAVIVMTNSAEGGSLAEDFCFSFLNKYQLSISDLFPPPITEEIHDATSTVNLSKSHLKTHIGNYAQSDGYIKVRFENNQLKMIDKNRQYILKPLTADEFLPLEIFEHDSLVERSGKRYIFKNIASYKFLFLHTGNREYESGLKLNKINRTLWNKRIGTYKHFGYQMIVGDTKFKEVKIYITEDNVLMMRLTTFGSVRTIPLRAITASYAVTSGINAGFGGFNVKFKEKDNYHIVDFAGITFRKLR